MRLFVQLALALFFSCSFALADCPPSCELTGGNDPVTDCYGEYAAAGVKLNYPFFDPAKPRPAKEIRCFDGDPGCDLDGEADGACTFDVDLCLRNDDPALPSCVVADISEVKVAGTGSLPGLQSLQDSVNALLPAVANVCTDGEQIVLPLKVKKGGVLKRSKKVVKATATGPAGKDKNKLKLSCIPHGWPTHGYSRRNDRASSLETTLNPVNAHAIEAGWTFAVAGASGSKGVTSTPTVDSKLVFASSWNGKVYGLSRKTGKVKWDYDTGSAGVLGVQSSVTLTADGRAVVGDSMANVHCLAAKKGKPLWTANVGDPVTEAAHVWGSPVVANNRVFVGRSSHGDQPCTQGHMYAFDLDTGAELWRYATVPAAICFADTSEECTVDADCSVQAGSTCDVAEGTCERASSVACTVDADCPSCVAGVGGGVTAGVAVSADGETIYMASVGCYTAPSIGNSDAIFSLNAADGAVNWIHRTQSIEQFDDGPFFHDYGFLNGPILAEVDDGLGGTQPLVIAGGKDGTLYAVDRDTGVLLWSNELAPAPEFAAFGLFNGAMGFADGRLFATLFQTVNWPSSNDHLYAFSAQDGSVAWSDDIGASWGHVGLANGLLLAGTQQAAELYVYDTDTGLRLNTLPAFDSVASGPSIVDGTVYVGYGVFGGTGGVMSFALLP
ncbi:MAG: PQQ-binding-like beta-propeller repeat protein [Proteobacteria bacterium]|nr:PQQ-binding-like beta-propeller repeat protein [Pseudomonadota bacterium]